MKYIFLFSMSFLFQLQFAIAHEEPAKTLREQSEKEKARTEIREKGIISYTVYKHPVKENQAALLSGEKFLTTDFDSRGNIVQMLVYKNSDSLDYKVQLAYDEKNNLISDTDYNADGTVTERIEYSFDDHGRAKEQVNYLSDGSIDSRFIYSIDLRNNYLTMTKFKPLDSVEYLIIYKYEGSTDQGNNTEILKQKPDGSLMLRVENLYDEKGQRTHKKIFDEHNQLLYYFEYQYFDGHDHFSAILKFDKDNQLQSKTVYSLNEAGLTAGIRSEDGGGNLLSYSSYRYTFR